jgi:ArsR family transcriptional regulator
LIAPRAKSVTCLDRSEKVLAAAEKRLHHHRNVRFARGDLLELPFCDRSFDHAMLFNVLACTDRPERAIEEAARVLRPDGSLAIVTLRKHQHGAITAAYGHVIPGFAPEELAKMIDASGLTVEQCEVTSRERRQPYFEVLTAFARK